MKKLILLFSLASLSVSVNAQNTGTGISPFGSYTQFGTDTVNNQNLNVVVGIPIAFSPGRGMPVGISLVNNSQIYQIVGGAWTPASTNPYWGWLKDFPKGGYVTWSSSTTSTKCGTQWGTQTTYNNYAYVDALGTSHPVPSVSYLYWCGTWAGGTYSGSTSDGTGFLVDASTLHPYAAVTGPGGNKVVQGTSSAVDVNGNYITRTIVSSTETDWTDSVGNTALKIIYTPNSTSPTQIQYEFMDGKDGTTYQTITLKLQSLSVKTNFVCSGVAEYSGTASVPQELDIPTPAGGTLKYTFSYESTPGLTGYYSGRLQRVTLPTGGYYEYDYPGAHDSVNCTDGTTVSLNRAISDGTNTATWNFVRNTASRITTITTPQLADTPNANDTVFTFNSVGAETQRQIYKESPGVNVLRTISTTWASNGTPATRITTLDDNSTKSEVDTAIDSNGLLDSLTEYDWGTGAHGSASPIRTTTLTYQTSTNYVSRHIVNLVTSKIIKDGSGATQYRQDIAYDGVALASCPTGVAQHDDSDFPCTMNYRGNPTAVTTYLTPATPANGITKNFTYDWFGNLLSAQLNCCQSKTWTYSATTQYSQPDAVISGTSPTLTTSATYNIHTGQITQYTDENNQNTNYSYDFLRRLIKTVRADNTQSTVTYDDVNFKTTSITPVDSTHSVQQIAASDQLGRTLTSTIEDTANTVYSIVKNEYDLAGRNYGTSNPYTSGSPSNWTTVSFDVLGRATATTLPDGSATGYRYVTNTVTVTDPAGVKRMSATDAAGRLTTVWEPDPTMNNSLTLQTSSTYNVLDELTQVSQSSQTRTFVYDALGRLLSSTTPESGMVCFGSVAGATCNADGYDNYNNLLKRTDARGVLTSYGYDGLNRLQTVTYSVSGATGVPATASVSLTYGTTPASFNNGRLITMTDGVGSENYYYNNLGLMTELDKVISGTTYKTKYSFNLANELTQITYPSGRIVQQSVDGIGRLCEVATSTTGCGTASSPFATAIAYNAANQTTNLKYGNGVYASFGFSSDRLQLTCLDYSTTNRSTCGHDATTKFGINYSYGTAGSNNGQISGITDSVDNGRSATYTYDWLYRLTRAVTTGSTGYPAWGLSETYDTYGNRTGQSIYSGCSGISCPTNSVSISTATNRITTSGYGYDLSGNMTSDGSNTLTYDAENRTTAATNGSNTGAYYYDGNGLRVKKTSLVGSTNTTTVYMFSGSKVIAEYDNGAAVASPSREYIYSGSALIAKIDSSGTKYYHQDHLSNRLITDSSGNTYAQLGHFPFGESWYNSTSDKLLFTSYERDAESGNDYAMARYNISRLGRFSSPDPLSGYISNPQSLNHYPYTANNPINFLDPTGMLLAKCDPFIDVDCSDPSGGGGGFGGFDPCSGPNFGGVEAFDPLGIGACDNPNTGLGDPGYGHGGGGGRGRVRVKLSVLSDCAKEYYNVEATMFREVVPADASAVGLDKLGLNGAFGGTLTTSSGLQFNFGVTANVHYSLQDPAFRGTDGTTTGATVLPGHPFENQILGGLSQQAAVETQLVELGNSLDFLNGTLNLGIAPYAKVKQMVVRDNQRDPNDPSYNNPPGNDLLNCVKTRGGLVKE